MCNISRSHGMPPWRLRSSSRSGTSLRKPAASTTRCPRNNSSHPTIPYLPAWFCTSGARAACCPGCSATESAQASCLPPAGSTPNSNGRPSKPRSCRRTASPAAARQPYVLLRMSPRPCRRRISTRERACNSQPWADQAKRLPVPGGVDLREVRSVGETPRSTRATGPSRGRFSPEQE